MSFIRDNLYSHKLICEKKIGNTTLYSFNYLA